MTAPLGAQVYFKNGQFGDAASMYTEGLELLEERHKDEKKYDAARAVLYNNRALMRLSTGTGHTHTHTRARAHTHTCGCA